MFYTYVVSRKSEFPELTLKILEEFRFLQQWLNSLRMFDEEGGKSHHRLVCTVLH